MNREEKLEIKIKKVGINYAWIKEHKNEKLLGIRVGLTARDLLIIFFMIEQLFEIEIQEKAIIEGQFATYEQIVSQIV